MEKAARRFYFPVRRRNFLGRIGKCRWRFGVSCELPENAADRQIFSAALWKILRSAGIFRWAAGKLCGAFQFSSGAPEFPAAALENSATRRNFPAALWNFPAARWKTLGAFGKLLARREDSAERVQGRERAGKNAGRHACGMSPPGVVWQVES